MAQSPVYTAHNQTLPFYQSIVCYDDTLVRLILDLIVGDTEKKILSSQRCLLTHEALNTSHLAKRYCLIAESKASQVPSDHALQ